MLGLDINGSDNIQKSSSNEQANDSCNHFSANEPSTRQWLNTHEMFHVYQVPKEVFNQGHMYDLKIYIKLTQI